MSNSVYYKATDEDGNTVLRHGWKKHKYLYIKNGKYVYPEDIYMLGFHFSFSLIFYL